MKCNPIRWLWGLIPLLALGGLMQLSGAFTDIETELKRISDQTLGASNQGWASTMFSGRDGTLVGEAVDNSDQLRAAGIVRSVTGVRIVDDQSKLIEEEKNYVWGAQLLADGKIRLSGFVPTPTVRSAVLGATKTAFPNRGIEDRMRLARGGPAANVWESGTGFGLKQLAALRPGARVDLDGNNLLIEGEAENLNTYKSVKTALQSSLPQGVRLRSDKVTPPIVKPYTWSAKQGANQVVLTGYVPNERARDDIFAAAKKAFPKSAVVDRMLIAAGEPKDWMAAVMASIVKIGRLEDGAAEFTDTQMSIAGLAADAGVADDLRRALKSDIPGTFKTTDALRIKEAPLKVVDPFTTGLNAANGVVTLTGYAPSPAARLALVASARQRFPGQRIDDRLEIANGAPDGWQTCAQAGIDGLGRLGAGRLQMSGRTLAVTGQTEMETLAQTLPGDVRTAAGSTCTSDVKVVFTGVPADEMRRRAEAEAAAKAAAAAAPPPAPTPPLPPVAVAPPLAPPAIPAPVPSPQQTQARAEAANCQILLTRIKNEGVINFKRASAEIDAQSNATLDKLVAVMNTCKSARVEVQGHTDAEGTPERNNNLSNRRAQSVLSYLTAAGVDGKRLTANGYGETRPIAPNDTRENMAKNRRIEFEVTAE
jgi:OmpA-OmpF porin, OOP family